MRSVRNRRFNKAFGSLPDPIQALARTAYKRFRANPFDPRLDFHPIRGTMARNVYAISVGMHQGTAYRALGAWDKTEDVVAWFWIGSHEAYNNLLTRI